MDYPQGDSNYKHKSRENAGSLGPRGTDSGTLADASDLKALAAALRGLSPAARAQLAAMLLVG